jgi:hypothetical protein
VPPEPAAEVDREPMTGTLQRMTVGGIEVEENSDLPGCPLNVRCRGHFGRHAGPTEVKMPSFGIVSGDDRIGPVEQVALPVDVDFAVLVCAFRSNAGNY